MQTAPLTVLDELYLYLDRPEEPFSVHTEMRVEGSLDPERLEAAVRRAALRHPIARARLADARAIDVHNRWEISDELATVDLSVVDCDGPARLARERERLLSRIPDLNRPGPFSLVLAHAGDGDVLIMNLHHAAGDGLSAIALMRSIARAYAGKRDPKPRFDALSARDLGEVAGGSLKQRIARGRVALEYVPRWVRGPARIAAQGSSERAGYGFELLCLEPAELAQLERLRAGEATLNDVLLGGLAVTVHRWDEEHGAAGGPVYLSMPVNMRPAQWRSDVVGNFAAYISVCMGTTAQRTLAAAIQAAARNTQRIKRGGVAGFMVDLFTPPSALPTGLKRHMQRLLPLTRNYSVDTAVLSNLGRLAPLPRLAEAGAVKGVWFSPPGRMPLGASLGAGTLDGRLFLTLRYRRAQFNAKAAGEFLDTFRSVLAA